MQCGWIALTTVTKRMLERLVCETYTIDRLYTNV